MEPPCCCFTAQQRPITTDGERPQREMQTETRGAARTSCEKHSLPTGPSRGPRGAGHQGHQAPSARGPELHAGLSFLGGWVSNVETTEWVFRSRFGKLVLGTGAWSLADMEGVTRPGGWAGVNGARGECRCECAPAWVRRVTRVASHAVRADCVRAAQGSEATKSLIFHCGGSPIQLVHTSRTSLIYL